MQKLTKQSFEEIKNWMYRNARPLEMAVYQYHFEHGSRENVLHALAHFQNEDGGFGHALEADSWNPNSSPYTITMALDVLKSIGFEDREHAVVRGVCRYLESGLHTENGKWAFSIPTNSDYPHAPWWQYSADFNAEAGYNPTGKLAAFILWMAPEGSALRKKGYQLAEDMAVHILSDQGVKDMEVEDYLELAETLEQCGLEEKFQLEKWKPLLIQKANAVMERDPQKWTSYCMRPAMYIREKESLLYPGNEEIMDVQADYLLENRGDDGVWDIFWNWAGTYPDAFLLSRNWWKSYFVNRYLILLRSLRRIEE